ncbi:MAG: hypothetical protein ACXU9U_01605 [Parachlamydiaceae bacterium]
MSATFIPEINISYSAYNQLSTLRDAHHSRLLGQGFTQTEKKVETFAGRKWQECSWEKQENWMLLALKIACCALLYFKSSYRVSFYEHLQNWNEVWTTGKIRHTVKLGLPIYDANLRKAKLWNACVENKMSISEENFNFFYDLLGNAYSSNNLLSILESIAAFDPELHSHLIQFMTANIAMYYCRSYEREDQDITRFIQLMAQISTSTLGKNPEKFTKVTETLYKIDRAYPSKTACLTYSNVIFPHTLHFEDYISCLERKFAAYLTIHIGSDIDRLALVANRAPLKCNYLSNQTLPLKILFLQSMEAFTQEQHDLAIQISPYHDFFNLFYFKKIHSYVASLDAETTLFARQLFNEQMFLNLFTPTTTYMHRTWTSSALATMQSLPLQRIEDVWIHIFTFTLHNDPLDHSIHAFFKRIPGQNSFDECDISCGYIKWNDYPSVSKLFRLHTAPDDWLSLLQAIQRVASTQQEDVIDVLEMIGGQLPHEDEKILQLQAEIALDRVTQIDSLIIEKKFAQLNEMTSLYNEMKAVALDSYIGNILSMLKQHKIGKIRQVANEARSILLPSLPVKYCIKKLKQLLKIVSSEERFNLIKTHKMEKNNLKLLMTNNRWCEKDLKLSNSD